MDTASYPTGSLDFLKRLHAQSDDGCTPSKVHLDIIIIGAGLGGLAAGIALKRRGHTVRIFEQAPELGEVGAGIQVPSNSAKLLSRWGIDKFWSQNVVAPENIFIRRWQSGDIIGRTRLEPFHNEFGARYYVIHRAHLHKAMYQLALDLGVEVRTGSKVTGYNGEVPLVTLENGTTHSANLIVAADGIKSAARAIVLGGSDAPPVETGFAAYRATVDVNLMKQDPDLSWLLQKPNLHLWIGDMRHVMSYTIAGGTSFNMVLSHPDKSSPTSWNQENTLKGMSYNFSGWDPRLTKLIGLITSALKWPLLSGTKLPRWTHPSGKLLIMGDAAHAMLPYMSEGAAMAIEDGAALAEAIHHAQDRTQLPDVLGVWEAERIKRTSQMQEASALNGKLWHYADGPEQEARDAEMSAEVTGEHYISSANQWSDPTTQRWCYGYDAEEAIRLTFKARCACHVSGIA